MKTLKQEPFTEKLYKNVKEYLDNVSFACNSIDSKKIAVLATNLFVCWLKDHLEELKEINIETGMSRAYVSDKGIIYDDIPEIAFVKKLVGELEK